MLCIGNSIIAIPETPLADSESDRTEQENTLLFLRRPDHLHARAATRNAVLQRKAQIPVPAERRGFRTAHLRSRLLPLPISGGIHGNGFPIANQRPVSLQEQYDAGVFFCKGQSTVEPALIRFAANSTEFSLMRCQDQPAAA